MSVNYYNSVTVKHSSEQPISLSQKLDKWGTKLIKSSQKAYGGKSYAVSGREVKENEGSGKAQKLSALDKLKAATGIAFKKVAAFFSSEVRTKYKLVGAGTAEEKQALLENLQPTRKISPKKEGDDGDFCAGFCAGLALSPPPRYHYYSPYRHHHHRGWHHNHHHGWHHHHHRRPAIIIR